VEGIHGGGWVAYGDGVGRIRGALGIRLVDVGATAFVAVVVELNVATGGGAGSHPLNLLAYVFGAILPLPILLRRKYPLQVLIACTVLIFVYYTDGFRRNISPAPLLSLPLYDAALAGYLTVSIIIPAVFMALGLFVVEATTHERLVTLASDFLPQFVVLALAIMLGEVVRSRRALATETLSRLRAAAEERESETARRVAEERLRIARELHDTVAHSMATITVQAGSALHVLGPAGGAGSSSGPGSGPGQQVHAALNAIRETSKNALADMRLTLGQLRGDAADVDAPGTRTAGLGRLGPLADAVRAAGAAVSITVEGEPRELPGSTDHAAYRILQESLTNVLRHAGPDARAEVGLRYSPGWLTLTVTDDGTGLPAGGDAGDAGGGHGLHGMKERAAAVGGELAAGPRHGGGFGVTARLPLVPTAPAAPGTGSAGPALGRAGAPAAGAPATGAPAAGARAGGTG
jgi:signal transduction histidine kinase